MAVLFWPFGRRRAESTPSAAAPSAGPSAGPAAEAPRDQWRELAPLERVVTSVLDRPVAASAPSFVRELPTRWTAPAAIQPLGHDVRPELVGGVVRGLTSTVAATTAATRESDAADLRWWRGRSARRRPAPGTNTAELSTPPSDAEPSPPGDERSRDELAGRDSTPRRINPIVTSAPGEGRPGVPGPADETGPPAVRPLATMPLPRTTPSVASRRPPAASATTPEPGYPAAPLETSADADTAAPVVRPDLPPADVAAAIAAGAVPGQPVQVVRVDPGAGPATSAATAVGPTSAATAAGPNRPAFPPPAAGSPAPVVPSGPSGAADPTSSVPAPPVAAPPVAAPPTGLPERRRRTWLGAPLPPTADLTTPPPTPPSAARRAAPAVATAQPDQPGPSSTVDSPADPDQGQVPDEPAPPVDESPASSSGAISSEWRDILRHSTNNAPLDGPDDPPTTAVSDPEPVPVAAPELDVVRPLTPETYPQRHEPSREELAGRYATPRQLNPIVATEPARSTPVVPNPAIGLQPITSRAAATTAPAIAAATALAATAATAADNVTPVRGLAQSAASLYERAAPFIPGAPALERDAESDGPTPAGLLGAATGPLGRAAAALPALPGSLPRLRPAAGRPGPAASLARAVPSRLPSPVELVAPGVAGLARAIPPGAGPAAAALAGAAGPIAASPARSATASGSASDDETAEPTDPAELDRLAGQLYGRIQRHLNADLLIGRERAQMLTDLG